LRLSVHPALYREFRPARVVLNAVHAVPLIEKTPLKIREFVQLKEPHHHPVRR
jgi:hypothetical protein